MKAGKFFLIPETPGDVEVLRAKAAPLDASTQPVWLDGREQGYYRYLASTSTIDPGPGDAEALLWEIEQLELAGLIVNRDSIDSSVHRVYIRSAADYDVWSIGIYTGQSLEELHPAPGVKNPVLSRDCIHDVTAAFVADPFVVRRADGWFMFFEILNWQANKGEIGLAHSSDGVHWQYERRVLVEPFHLSYPYVFAHEGKYYMVPEARQSAAIRLYQAIEFPVEWRFVGTLIKTDSLVDASVFQHNCRWWLLAGDSAERRHDTLRLYSANTLTGPWAEHPASPVVRGNPQTARPAGRIVTAKSRVYRFAQNCHPRYGIDVRAFEITELTPMSYRETPVGAGPILGPSRSGWNAGGMHHLDVNQLDDGTWLAYVDGWANVG
jgi:Glycosyl hydrolases family 43